MNHQLINTITSEFVKIHGTTPIIINSPGRINIIGEHTDYNEGFVFPAAIDKGIYTAIEKSNTDFCTAIALDINESYEFTLENLKPIKNGGWRNYIVGVVAELQKQGKKTKPFNLVFGGDIPAGSGLSSSAALENSIVFGLNEVFNLELTKSEMILISQKAEHNFAGVRCGIMDQYASMFGIKEHALLLDCRTQKATPFHIDFKEYQIVLINTNVKHNLAENAYNDRRNVCEKVASLLNITALRDANEENLNSIKKNLTEEEFQKALYIIQENKRTLEASKKMKNEDILGLGKLLFESHNGLQHQYKVSCPELDFLVEKAKESSVVIGSRMMGGGFGGCTINIVKKNNYKAYLENIKIAYKKEFNKECTFHFVEISNGTHRLQNVLKH
ncbi:galactokinase [Urechidicola croceus]|uniref:Galactokinase n=1 Tax=Urechidicola croceus TaxID=1850246 RepID=A0A1D8P6E1_9FLAO|nr:galactokinase [Urechidicola croceus]AOW20135.1 galactokinase [Urechidicola croceus]